MIFDSRFYLITKGIAVLLIVIFSCLTDATARVFPGFVDIEDGRAYLHTPASITEIVTVAVQYPGVRTRCCIKLRRAAVKPAVERQITESDRVTGNDPVFKYLLSTPKFFALDHPFIGMALINVNSRIASDAASMQGRENTLGFYRIEKCIGKEGVNLSVRSANSEDVNIYYGVGYEIDISDTHGESMCGNAAKVFRAK